MKVSDIGSGIAGLSAAWIIGKSKPFKEIISPFHRGLLINLRLWRVVWLWRISGFYGVIYLKSECFHPMRWKCFLKNPPSQMDCFRIWMHRIVWKRIPIKLISYKELMVFLHLQNKSSDFIAFRLKLDCKITAQLKHTIPTYDSGRNPFTHHDAIRLKINRFRWFSRCLREMCISCDFSLHHFIS